MTSPSRSRCKPVSPRHRQTSRTRSWSASEPPQEREVLAVAGRVELDEAGEQLGVGDALEDPLEAAGPVAGVPPEPVRLIMELDRGEQPLVGGVAFGEAPCDHRMVVLPRPSLAPADGRLEGVVDDRHEAKV